MERKKQDAGETILSIENVKLLENASNTVSLDVHAGEILGIAGVEGNGQMQLEEMIMGLQKCKEGKISIKGEDITECPTKKRLGLGMSYIPSERHQRAILPGFSILENYLLGNQNDPKYVQHGWINFKTLSETTKN